MIHVHPHQETLDPFRISHSESSKNYGCVRQGFVSLCWHLIKKKKKLIPFSPCLDFGEANPADTAKISIINGVGILKC